jgi:hypothetical protein
MLQQWAQALLRARRHAPIAPQTHCGATLAVHSVCTRPRDGRQDSTLKRHAMLSFLRFLAAVLVLIAVIAGVYDATLSLSAHDTVMTSLLEHWTKLAPTLLNSARDAVRRSTHPAVWDAGVAKVLLLPTWGVFGLLGLLAAYAGRRRRRTNIFAN